MREHCYRGAAAAADGGGCCCAYWEGGGGANRTCAAAFAQLRNPGCVPRAHALLRRPWQSHRSCGRYAVALSGQIRELQVGWDSFVRYVLDTGAVDVHAHLAAPSAYFSASSDALGPAHSASRAALWKLLNLSQLGSVTVEPDNDDDAAAREVRACAMEGAGDAFIDEVRRRHEYPSNPAITAREFNVWHRVVQNWSVPKPLLMYRRIFLAHRLVIASRCEYAAVLRARPDVLWMAERRQAIPPKLLCWVDDQVAVGRLEGMSMYSSVYPDFDAAGFATSMPLHRADAYGHFAERILTAHLHWCGASVTASRSFSVGYVLSREWRTRLSTFSEGKGRD